MGGDPAAGREPGETAKLGHQMGLVAVAQVGGEGGPVDPAAGGRAEDPPEPNHPAEGLGRDTDVGREPSGEMLARDAERRREAGYIRAATAVDDPLDGRQQVRRDGGDAWRAG